METSMNLPIAGCFMISRCPPPKSISIAALVGNDQRIIEAHDEAVQVAMHELQLYAATRVRQQNQYAHRVTGQMWWARCSGMTRHVI